MCTSECLGVGEKSHIHYKRGVSSAQMSTLVSLTCVFCACVCALLWLQKRRARSLLAHLPAYTQLPLIGNMHQVLGNSEHIFGVINNIAKIMDEKGMPFVLWFGPQPIVLVCDPDDVRAVTNAYVDKPYYYNFASDWVGNGLVTAPSHIWKRSIKKLAGTFTVNIVDGYQDVFNAQAAKLVDKLRAEVGGEPFDVLHRYLAYTTLEAICQTALGVSCVSESIVTSDYYGAFVRTFELMIERGVNLPMHLDWLYHLTPSYKELKSCIAVLHNVSESIMKKRKIERKEKKEKENLQENDLETSKTRLKAFLDILLDMEEVDPSLTDEQIRAEVDTIIVGGQETVAVTLFMTILMLGCKPDVQNKLYEEMKEIFGDSKRSVEKADLLRMRYCDAVVHETLRMFPPLPCVMREADRELELKSCTIPKGTFCCISTWAAGRSQRIWGSDADQYRPERWMEEDGVPGNPGSFLPFSYGKRACIGKRYAIPILKTILAHCVRELKFTSEADNLRLKVDVSLKPVSGHLIQVNLR